MGKFGESSPVENIENIESGAENDVESPEIVSEKVSESSQEALEDGDNLLQNVSESMGLEEVEGGQGLLEAAKGKLAGVGDRIQDLALATRQRIKEAITGKDLKDMTDDELADHLRKKREEHKEAAQHNRSIRRGEKFDLGGFRAAHALDQEMKRKMERADAAREVKKRGMEVLTPEEERDKKISEINSKYIRLMQEKKASYTSKERREEIASILSELESQASKIDYQIPSHITENYTPEEIREKERKKREERWASHIRASAEEKRRREEFPHWTEVRRRQREEREESARRRKELEHQEKIKKQREQEARPKHGGPYHGQ